MAVGFADPAVGGPACVSDPNRAGERCAGKPLLEVLEFAFRAQPRQVPVLKRRNPGGIVAAIFQPLEQVDDIGNRLAAENSDYSAHSVHRLHVAVRVYAFRPVRNHKVLAGPNAWVAPPAFSRPLHALLAVLSPSRLLRPAGRARSQVRRRVRPR